MGWISRLALDFGLPVLDRPTKDAHLRLLANIVLMNVEKLEILGTEIEPRKHPKGVEYVLVNGELAVEKGKHTGARAGKVLRHGK